jgi:hypothetical protein
MHIVIASQAASTVAMADVIIIAFLVLLRPNKYTATSSMGVG